MVSSYHENLRKNVYADYEKNLTFSVPAVFKGEKSTNSYLVKYVTKVLKLSKE